MTWLGEAALDQGRPDAAEPLFAKAVSLEPALSRGALRAWTSGAG